MVSSPAPLEPSDYVGVKPHGNRLFLRLVKLADFCGIPIEHSRRIREVNILVSFFGYGANVALLLFREFLHRLAFHEKPPRALR